MSATRFEAIKTHLSFLDRIEREFRKSAESEPVRAGEHATVDQLNAQRFAQLHPEFQADIDSARDAIADHKLTLAALRTRRFQCLVRRDIADMKAAIATATALMDTAYVAFATALSHFQADPQQLAAGSKIEAMHRERVSRRNAAETIAGRAKRLRNRLARESEEYGALVSDVLPRSASMPASFGPAHLTAVNGYLDQLDANLASQLAQLASRHAATLEAQELIDTLHARMDVPTGTSPPSFSTQTAATLSGLLRPDVPTADEPLAALLSTASDPAAFRHREAWLVLWTAISATLGYSRNFAGSEINENMRAGGWIGAWVRQMERWSEKTIDAIGIEPGQLRSAVFQLQNTTAETRTGADMMLMLLVTLPSRCYCSVVNVQFKRPANDETVIDVDNKGWRQFDTLARLQTRSAGRFNAFHALFRNIEDGLATIPAVAVAVSKEILSRQPDLVGAPEKSKLPSRVPWTTNGDALPTALASALCLASNFATVADALAWMKTHNDVELPEYMVIQAVGEDTMGFEYAMRHAVDLGLNHVAEHAIGQDATCDDAGPDYERPGMGW